MDAASHTGVDDVREIIEAVRYASVSARYKVYIIDEVHMLSKNAFNALLKTLEEPPPHVKFLFATTEIGKVPLTVLSRCQRFDLRRIPAETLTTHFAWICEQETVEAEPEALTLIARAAEGSVRDGLSILDQAIAHADLESGGRIVAAQVRTMLGLSDRGALHRLLGLALAGDAAGTLAGLREQFDLGVDPADLLRGLLEIVHAATRIKIGGSEDPALPEDARAALSTLAAGASFATLHRIWQLLLKGHGDVGRAPDPYGAADMALLRLIHAAQLPDPSDLAQLIARGGASAAPVAQTVPPASTLPASFAAMIAVVEGQGKHRMAQQLRDEVGEVRYAPPELVIRPTRPFDLRELAQVLRSATGATWTVTADDGPAQPTLRDQQAESEKAARDMILAEPIVAALMTEFPGAQLINEPQQWSATS